MSEAVETQTAKALRALMIFSVGSSVLVFGGTALIIIFVTTQDESIIAPTSIKYIADRIIYFGSAAFILISALITPTMVIVALFFVYFKPLRRLETYAFVCIVAPTINTLIISVLLDWPVSFWKIFDILGQHAIACLTLGIVVVPLIWSLTYRWHNAKILPYTQLDSSPP